MVYCVVLNLWNVSRGFAEGNTREINLGHAGRSMFTECLPEDLVLYWLE